MADAAIGATIQVVLETVLSLANDRIDQVLGFKEELKRLSKTAERIQGFVADADNKKHSPEVLDWLKDLEGEVFKAENVLDRVKYEILRREVKYPSQFKRKVCFFFSFFSTIGFRSRMASKIREINANLERINQDASKFELVTRYQIEAALQVPDPAAAATTRQTDSVVVPNVVGRADDESKIVEMLLSPSDKVVSVIPIVGMGGLGKTTLAKSAYNHSQIDGHFDEKIWVCLAEKVEILELFKFILESLTQEKVEVDRRDAIIKKIQEKLRGKRYFLVLDDVWNDEQGLWDDFFSTLEGLNTTKGSWCLATTRLEPAAYTMSRLLRMNVGPHKLGKLSDDECWSILKGKVVAGEEVPIELEEIKMKILRRCGGLPLSAKLIGGLLLNKRKEEWRFIVEESLLNADQDDVKKIIKMSFDHLPSTSVKNCFAYCSLFPQDTKLDKDLLIELWMAEVFLQPDSKKESLMEAIGENCFRILLHSSLLEEVNEWGKTCYKMHDLVHDFAKSALNEDRYLALTSSRGTTQDVIKKNSTSLRTLFLDSSISEDDLSKFESLHVLNLFAKDVNVLPNSIGKLIHLRFLCISDSQITKLPKSLCKLYNLQTLRIKDGNLEDGLPKQMSNLISLRHLHYYDTRAEFQMPLEMGRLTHLQTLKFFNIGQEDGRGVEELGTLKDLKGSLEIRNIELVNSKQAAEGAKLFEKPNLSKLKYLWGSGDRESNNCDENVLEGLQPPQNLQKLEIRNFVGDQFPEWFINLSTLVELKLIDCKRCRELPALGQLPSLEGLELKGLKNITTIGLSFYGISSGGGDGQVVVMPSLKYLSLEKMNNLVEWKDEGEVRSTTGAAKVDLFPVLEILHITDCSQLTSAPSHFPSIEKLDIRNNCCISLVEKIARGIPTPSYLELKHVRVTSSHNDGHKKSLNLVKWRHSYNLEEDIECCLSIDGTVDRVAEVPSEMLERLCHLPSLRDLKLALVHDLTRLACGTSLKSLTLYCCDDLRQLPHDLDKFQALRDLTITECHGLISLPGKMSCASLRILKVSGCDNLVSFPLDLQQTPSLEILDLANCPKLMIANMPKGFDSLTSLGRLTIGPLSIDETTEFDWSKLISSSSSTLTYLYFYGLPHVESLPEQLQNLTSLTELRLHDFGIEALPDWIGNLASLERLWLWNCKKLLCLPSTDAMRSLTKLTSLQVLRSPLLKERCNSQSGPNSEWPKISHIRYLEIA